MEKLRNWLVRHRDQTLVSYSRFGRAGEEEDDRPPPTSIIIAPFDENSPEFVFFKYWHIQKAAVALSCFGMSMVILFFLSAFFEFDWYHHERGVDFGALLGLFTYLTLGVLIHYYVLYGVKKQIPYYLLPFIVVYSVLCTGEFILCVALFFKMMDNSTSDQPSSVTSAIQIQPPVISIFLVTFASVMVQMIMLSAVVKCRQYISFKLNHDMEIKVAEKSRTKNPSIQIIVANSTASANEISNNNGNNMSSQNGVNGNTVNGRQSPVHLV